MRNLSTTKLIMKSFLNAESRCKKKTKINKITRKSTSSNDHQRYIMNILPKEIMMNIMSRVSLSTYIRFGLACYNNESRHEISDPKRLDNLDGVSINSNLCATLLVSDESYANRNNFLIEYHVNDNTRNFTSISFDFIKDLENDTTLFEILVSYRGWLLVRLTPDYYVCCPGEPLLRLVNPMTRQCLVLPKSRKGPVRFNNNHYRFHGKYLMGCSPTTGQYKVVRISLCDCEGKGSYVQVLSLCNKPDKAKWRTIKIDDHVQDILYGAADNFFLGDQVELNGALHLYVNLLHKILRFDIDKEEFDILSIPRSKEMYAKSLSLLGTSICLLTFITNDVTCEDRYRYGYDRRDNASSSNRSEIWVMKEYGKDESWTKLNGSSSQQGDMIQVLEDGKKLIMFNSHHGLYVYDRETKDFHTKMDIPRKGDYSTIRIVQFSPRFLS